jgi:protein SCO1/2
MDPDGKFVDAFGQQVTADEARSKIDEVIGEWQKDHGGRAV